MNDRSLKKTKIGDANMKDEEVLSNSSRKRRVDSAAMDEDEYLEQVTMNKYLEHVPQRKQPAFHVRTGDISMIMYRMYLLNHKRAADRQDTHCLRNREILKPPGEQPFPHPAEIDHYWGRIDFAFHCDKYYVLSAARRTFATYVRRSDVFETIFCDNTSGLVSAPHCELMRPKHSNEFVWITDLKSEHGTYVNGKRITPEAKYKLVDGDIVSLGIPHNCPDDRVDIKTRRFYIFKLKNLDKRRGTDALEANEESDAGDNSVELAMNNVLILDKILRFMKLADLKICRLVNRFWKARADRRMLTQTQVKFEFRYYSRHMPLSVSEVEWSELFQRKVSLIKKYKLDSFEIDIANANPALRGPPRQFYSDITWLLTNMGHFMKDLILSMTIVQDKKGKEFNKIMSTLTNLETLDLSLDIHTGIYPILGSYPLQLPSLKFLTIWIHDVDGDEELRDPLKNHIVAELEKLFPNLQGVTAKTGMIQNFLQFLTTNRDKWKNLTAFSGEFELYGETENPVMTFTSITSLNQRLTRLQLDDIPSLTVEGVAAFEKMLKKHAITLQFLSLKFAEPGTEDAPTTITIPSFPNLTFLQLIIYVEDTNLNLTLQFPGGSISYEKDFPKLKVLSLLPSDAADDDSDDGTVSNIREIFLTFLPQESTTVSRTMRWVEFSLEKEWTERGNEHYVWYTNFLRRFRRTFPFVNHPDIVQGLKYIESAVDDGGV